MDNQYYYDYQTYLANNSYGFPHVPANEDQSFSSGYTQVSNFAPLSVVKAKDNIIANIHGQRT